MSDIKKIRVGGVDYNIPSYDEATTEKSGLMSASDKIKLDNLANGEFATKGVEIVSSVDDLDPNAEHGSLAAVASETLIEVKFSIKDISVHNAEPPIPVTEFKFNTSNIPSELQGGQYAVFATVGWNGSIVDLIEGRFQGKVLGFEMQEPGSFIVTITDLLAEEVQQQIPIIINGTIDEDGVLNLNNTIESWGGVVFHGIVDLNSDSLTLEMPIPEPTEEQYSDWDLLFGYNYTEIKTLTEIYIKEPSEWVRINDVKIIDSVGKLDKNAPQGSLASVAVNTISEVPFSELYQPTSDEVNMGTGAIDTTNLSRINSISVNSSFDTSVELQNFAVYLFSKDIDVQVGVGQAILLGLGVAAITNIATQGQQELELFTPNEDGTITVNEENLAIINNLLSSTEFVYGGGVNMNNGESIDSSFVDVFYKTIEGIQKTDLYIKDVNGWRVVSDEELEAKVDNLQTSVDNLDLIVNSVDELPQNAPLGSLAKVLEDYPVITKVSSFRNVANKERVWEVNIEKSATSVSPGLNTSELVSKDGTESIFLNTVVQSNVLKISYTDGENSISLGNYNYAGTPPSLKVDIESLKVLNEKLKTKEFVYVKPTGSDGSEGRSWFVPTILKKSKKTILYTKNELGWEQCAVGGPYNSVEGLPQNAPLGSLARVLNTKFVSFADIPANTKLESIDIYAPQKIDKNFLNYSNLTIYFTDSTSTSNYSPVLSISIYGSGLHLAGSMGSGMPTTLAIYDSEGIRTSIGDIGYLTEQFNEKIKQGYAYLSSVTNKELSDLFFKAKAEGFVGTTIYVKDTSGWEQYSELVDDSVTTEKVADGAITMEKLAEDVQEIINSSVTTEKVADGAIVLDKLSVDIQKVLAFAIQHFGIIIFKDKEIETICVTNWDTNDDGLLTKEEANAVTDISVIFKSNTKIVSFDELSNFTSLISIPEKAFYSCPNLTSITIPASVTSIGNNAFYQCSRFKSITIPEDSQLTSIGVGAFYRCRSLKTINIPKNVTSIENLAFADCDGLTYVYSYATTPPVVGASTFSDTPTTMVIYVPDESVDAYKGSWVFCADQIKPMSEYVEPTTE